MGARELVEQLCNLQVGAVKETKTRRKVVLNFYWKGGGSGKFQGGERSRRPRKPEAIRKEWLCVFVYLICLFTYRKNKAAEIDLNSIKQQSNNFETG